VPNAPASAAHRGPEAEGEQRRDYHRTQVPYRRRRLQTGLLELRAVDAEFKRQGRLGCAECYVSFHDQLVPLIRAHSRRGTARRQDGERRAQAGADENERAEAARACPAQQDEDYEKAAALRDQLRQTEEAE